MHHFIQRSCEIWWRTKVCCPSQLFAITIIRHRAKAPNKAVVVVPGHLDKDASRDKKKRLGCQKEAYGSPERRVTDSQ